MHPSSKLQAFAKKWLPLTATVFILIQPLLDVLTALGANAGHAVTAGVIVRTLFMAVGFVYVVFLSRFEGRKYCLIYLGVLVGYLALFMLYMLSLGGFSLCLANARESVKIFFAPVVLVFLYAMYKQYGFLVPMRALGISGGIYAGVIMLAWITGTSNVSYSTSGYGYNGWFYAANETSTIIALAAPVVVSFCLGQLPKVTKKTWWQAALIALALISISFSANFIGTKIVFLAVSLYCVTAFIWSLVRYRKDHERNSKTLAIALGLLCLLVFSSFLTSPLRAYLGDIYLPVMEIDPEELLRKWGAAVRAASEGTWLRELLDNNMFFKRLDQILSRRLLTAASSVQVYTDGGIAAKLLGIGHANIPSYGRSIEFLIEMDPLSMLIRHGILGALLTVVPYTAAIVHFVVQFFKRAAQRLSSLEYCSLLYSTLLAFAISVIAGHVLVSPGVSIYVLVIGLSLEVMTREQNQEPLPGGRD